MTEQKPDSHNPSEEAFSPKGIDRPHVYLQWKGTDACFDFFCECGASYHFDGYFAYNLHCGACDSYWEMPFNLFPRKLDAKPGGCIVKLVDDEEKGGAA